MVAQHKLALDNFKYLVYCKAGKYVAEFNLVD